jgi:hypothetical protein
MKAQGTTSRIVFASSILLGMCACMLLANSNSYGASITLGYYNAQYQYTLVPAIDSDNYQTTVNADGSYHWEGSYSNSNLTVNWKLDYDGDPIVSGFVGLTNNSSLTNTFTVIVNQPIAPALPTSVMNGSTAWTVTDNDGDGAMLNASTTGLGNPGIEGLYNALVDGTTVRKLFNALTPDPLLPITAGPFASNSQSEGFSGEITPIAANSSIGIYQHFTLSGNDSASATSVFRIVATNAPEPSSITLAVMGLAGAALAYRRRR